MHRNSLYKKNLMIINKDKQKAELYQKIDETTVSTGRYPGDKKRSGDNKTPLGAYKVVSIHNSKEWLYDGIKAYGPYFVRLNCGSWDRKGNHNPKGRSSIGIHGTNEPEKLGELASHGCIRIESELIKKYVEQGYLKKGTTVIINGEQKNHYQQKTNQKMKNTSISSLEKKVLEMK